VKCKRLLISIFLVLFLINLGGGLFASSTKVKITFMSTKGEINPQLEEVF